MGIKFWKKNFILPLANHLKLSSDCCPKIEDELDGMSKICYANAIGSIIYLMICIRLDLAHNISVLRRFIGNRREENWEALK